MPMLSEEERKKGQERGKQYTQISGQEIANIEQSVQNQQQPRSLGVQYAPPSPPLDLSRGQVPFMAEGFTPAGEPYYGPGVKGYLRGAFARIFDPEPLQESFNQQQRDQIRAVSADTTNKVLEALPFLNDYREYVSAFSTAALSTATDPTKVLGTTGRGIKELGFAGLNALSVGEKPFRYQFAGQQALADISGNTIVKKEKRYGDIRDTLLQYNPTTTAQSLYKIAGKRRAEGDDFRAFLATVGAALQGTGLGTMSEVAGIFFGSQALTDIEKKKFQNYQRGSNMVYSTMIDEGKRQDYIRRAQAGENPDFLVEELQNPWVELAGSLVFDTLNFLPVPAKGKRLASAGDEFAKIIDPDIAKAVNEGTKVLSDADALPLAQRVGGVITEKINQSANKMVSWGNSKDAYKIFNPTAEGKQFLVGRRVGTVIEFVAKNASSADEGAEVISMMTRAYKGNQEAIAYLLRSKYAHMVYSQAGVDTMAMLGRLSDELGGTKFLDTVKKATSADDLLKFISPKMEKTIENMLPSLEDMQKAVKAVAKGTATDVEKALAKQYDQVAPSIKAAEMVNKKLGKFYAPFNRFFASAYMGLSPGYAFRNLISDTTAVFADQGARSALKNIGGNVKDLFSAGAVTQRRIDDLAKLGIAAPSPALAGKGAHAGALGTEGAKKFLGIFPDMRAVAESFEQGSSVNIFANAVKREMKRAVKNGMLPDLSGLKDLGVTQTAVDELVRLTLVNDGNVGAAMKQWRKMATDGKLLLRKQINLPEATRGFLSHLGLDSQIDELLDGTADDFQRGVEEIKEALIRQAEKVVDEEVRVADDAAQELVNVENALSDISEKLPLDERLFRARRQALNNVISSTEDAFNETLKHLETNGYKISDLATSGLREMRSRFDEVANRTRKVTDSIFSKKTGLIYQKGDLASLWRGVRIHGKDLGPMPAGLTEEMYRNAVYNLWKDTTKREWAKAGDNYYQTLFDLVRETRVPDIDRVLTSELWQKAAANVDEMHLWTDVASWDNVVPYWLQQTLDRVDKIPDDVLIGNLRNWELKRYGWVRGKRGLGNLANKVAGDTERAWDEVPAKEALNVLNEWKLAVSRGEGFESAEQTVLKARELLGQGAETATRAVQGEAIGEKPIHLWTREEYLSQLEKATKSGKDIEVELFGKEGAKRYSQAQAKANSAFASDDEIKLADQVIDTMEGGLTEAQQARLFGTDVKYSDEELKAFKDAFDDVSDMSDEFLIGQLKRNMPKFSPDELSKLNAGEVLGAEKEIAFIKTKNAIAELAGRGLDPNAVMEQVFRDLAGDIDPEDAQYLLRQWLERSVKKEQPVALTPGDVSSEMPLFTDLRHAFSKTPTNAVTIVGTDGKTYNSGAGLLNSLGDEVTLYPGDGSTIYANTDFIEEVRDASGNLLWKKGTSKITKEAAKATGVGVEEAAKIPRSELPEDVSTRIAQEAQRLLSELHGGEGPGVSVSRQLEDYATQRFGTTNVPWYRDLPKKMQNKKAIDNALNKIIEDAGKDKGVNVQRMKEIIIDNFTFGDAASGTPPDLSVLKSLGAPDDVLNNALEAYNQITKQSLSLADALKQGGYTDVEQDLLDLGYEALKGLYDEIVKKGKKNLTREESFIVKIIEDSKQITPPPPVLEESPPGLPRQLYDQIDSFLDDIGQWSDEVMNVWNDTEDVFTNPEIEKVLGEVERVAAQRFEQAKAFSTAVGVAERDFALHKYGDKTYMDVIAGFIFPYHYWYTRSTPKWLLRSIENPALVAAYGKYRRTLEGLHAGMPDWWKYNLSTNDLPGVDMESPLYFNLEATLNPVNGLTGVDFNDSTKRATWYSRMVDDLGKFGPTTFTPISWLVAAGLYSEGETEAAERWMGRLIPATSTLKSVLNLANLDTPLPYNEVDPFVQIFSGGLDPWERRRVGRALSGLVGTNGITEEQTIDAAYRQSGPLWDEAFQVASDDRALGNISSFVFGVGFKGRNESEIAIDSFYDEYFNLKDLYFGNVISPEEYKDQLAYLKDRYPFMDTVLLSRRSGEDRDTAYAFNVFSRIPPGQSEIINAFGITRDELNQFYDDPYAIDEWDQAKRDKFLGSVYELSTAFQLPNTATRLDWNAARNTYKNLNTQLKEEFGDDILDQMDYYYNEKDKEISRMFLDAHPELQAAMDRRTELIVLTPNLMQYYGGLDTLDRYLTGKMYDRLELKYGSDITQRSQEYSDAKYRLFNPELAKRILNENPNLRLYWKDKSKLQDEITRALALYGTKIETVMPQVRPDYVGDYEQPTPTSYQEWQNILGDPMMQALDNYVRGGNLPKNVESELDYFAKKYGYENGYDLAVDALSAQIDNSGIPDAYIARAILDNSSTLQELVALGGDLPPEAQQEILWLASVYGVSPDFVYSVVAGE